MYPDRPLQYPRTPRYSVFLSDTPTFDELKSELRQLQNYTDQFLRSISEGLYCETYMGGQVRINDESDQYPRFYLIYNANFNTLWACKTAASYLGRAEQFYQLSDESVNNAIFTVLSRTYEDATPMKKWAAVSLMLEPVRFIMSNRRREP